MERELWKTCASRRFRQLLAVVETHGVMTPSEFAAHVEKELALNTALLKAVGLKAQ
jgi:hypothetical protein